jgi:hypothetical protein
MRIQFPLVIVAAKAQKLKNTIFGSETETVFDPVCWLSTVNAWTGHRDDEYQQRFRLGRVRGI